MKDRFLSFNFKDIHSLRHRADGNPVRHAFVDYCVLSKEILVEPDLVVEEHQVLSGEEICNLLVCLAIILVKASQKFDPDHSSIA